jgi:hypothetical protein
MVPKGKKGHGQKTANSEVSKKSRIAAAAVSSKNPFLARRTGKGNYVHYASAAAFVAKNRTYLDQNKDKRGKNKAMSRAVSQAVRRKQSHMLGELFEIKPSNKNVSKQPKKMSGPFHKFNAYINMCHRGWTPLPGYGANKHGFIRKSNGSIVLGTLKKNGYRRVGVRCKHKTKPNKTFIQAVSQLVAAACKLKKPSTRHTSLDHINDKDTGNNAVRPSV